MSSRAATTPRRSTCHARRRVRASSGRGGRRGAAADRGGHRQGVRVRASARGGDGVIRIYRQLLIAQIQAAAQYRIQAVLWMLFSIIRPVIFLAAWTAVSTAQGGSVGGYTTSDFAAYYIALTIVGHLTTAWNSFEFEFEVRQGRLSPKLLRPLHPLHYSVVENLIWKLTTLPALVPALIPFTFAPPAPWAS